MDRYLTNFFVCVGRVLNSWIQHPPGCLHPASAEDALRRMPAARPAFNSFLNRSPAESSSTGPLLSPMAAHAAAGIAAALAEGSAEEREAAYGSIESAMRSAPSSSAGSGVGGREQAVALALASVKPL